MKFCKHSSNIQVRLEIHSEMQKLNLNSTILHSSHNGMLHFNKNESNDLSNIQISLSKSVLLSQAYAGFG